MLGFGNEGVMSVVPHYLREYDVFKNLAPYTCEGDGSVVSSFLFRAFLVYSDHIRGEPVLGEASIPTSKGFSGSVKIGANSRLHSFSTVFGIRSGPLALLIFTSLSITSGLRWHRLLSEACLVGYMTQWVQVLCRHLS